MSQTTPEHTAKHTAEQRYRAPALDKGLDILELLAHQPNGMTRAEIVKAMGRSPSEIYRMIERLVMRQYLHRSLEGDRYSLTMKLFVLGSHHPPLRRMAAQAQPLMDQFANANQQSLHLVAPDRGMVVVIAQASAPVNWEFRLRLGSQLDLINTGSGQTFLAFQSRERQIQCLSCILPDDSSVLAKLAGIAADLSTIKAAGHRQSPSRQLVGVTDLSAPILSPNGEAMGVLTCPYIERIDLNNHHKVSVATALANVKALAHTLSIA